jgi:hypothetical protein
VNIKTIKERLEHYPDEYEIKFANDYDGELEILSIYTDDAETVWVDLGENP